MDIPITQYPWLWIFINLQSMDMDTDHISTDQATDRQKMSTQPESPQNRHKIATTLSQSFWKFANIPENWRSKQESPQIDAKLQENGHTSKIRTNRHKIAVQSPTDSVFCSGA